jgi:NitT/TauT family transport system permease protein
MYLSTPSAVIAAGYRLLVSGELLSATWISMQSLLAGFALALAVGVPVGLLMGRSRFADRLLDVYVAALYVTPTLALLPMIILWFGLGFEAKLCLIFLSAFFPLVVSTRQGAKDVSAALLEVGDAFVLSPRAKVTKILVWAIFPYVISGLRLGLGRAIGTMIVAELVTRAQGLGALLLVFSGSFRTDQLLVPIAVLVVLGIGLTELLKVAERKIAPWQAASQG